MSAREESRRGRRRADVDPTTRGSLSLDAPAAVAVNMKRGFGIVLALVGVAIGVWGITLGNSTLHTVAGDACGTYFSPAGGALACTQAANAQGATVMLLIGLGVLIAVGGLVLTAISLRRARY